MKQFLTLALTCFAFNAYAQPSVVSAYNANKSGDFEAAVGYIEEAMNDEKAIVKDKTWRYRGQIYINVAKDTTLSANYPDALWKAKESYTKAEELDVKNRYTNEIRSGFGEIQALSGTIGINAYNQGDFMTAGKMFDLGTEIAGAFDVIDTMSIFNAALCYEKSNEVDLAIERYKSCGNLNYQVPNVYLFISTLLRNADRTEDALIELQAARELFPREQGLIIEELNIYLENGDYERAENNLKLAAEGDPENEILWFSLGSVYDNLEKTDEAAVAYQKALDIQPDYFDANYNLGAMYFNDAVLQINAANDMWKPRMSSDEQAEQEKLEADGKAMFSQAKPYLEAAHVAAPEDVSTIRSLRDIYTRTGEDDKMLEMSAKLKDLGAQ
ncbi:MAG: tetratricopeptide repeat protein [Flavobacteriales bacterium]